MLPGGSNGSSFTDVLWVSAGVRILPKPKTQLTEKDYVRDLGQALERFGFGDFSDFLNPKP